MRLFLEAGTPSEETRFVVTNPIAYLAAYPTRPLTQRQ